MSDISTGPMRNALAWATNDPEKASEPSTNPFVWFWEAVEGDFNENRTTAQILTDAAISMIPLVDQLCDIRDLIANVKKLTRDTSDGAAWLSLILTLIGLFPFVGSLVKGVLKIFFAFIRRSGGQEMMHAINTGMTWVINFLRRREVQQYLKRHKIDDVFRWLHSEIKAIRAQISVAPLLSAFNRIITVIDGLVRKVELIPIIGGKAINALKEVKKIRLIANDYFASNIKPIQDLIDSIALRFEKEISLKQNAIVNVTNIHYRGALPEAAAVSLMRKRKPAWLSRTNSTFIPSVKLGAYRPIVNDASAKVDALNRRIPHSERYPALTDQNILSFATLATHTIKGLARLYRILAPNSKGMSDCWVTEEVFKKLQSAKDPKSAWRKYLAVWPDWNVNGQFVIYDVKAGESLNVWRGTASSQTKKSLPGFHLDGGYEQIIFKVTSKDVRNDKVLYYKVGGGKNPKLGAKPLTQQEVDVLTKNMNPIEKQLFYQSHLSIRESINHPNISGPFETNWGYNEFDGDGLASRIGLPELPGQVTSANR